MKTAIHASAAGRTARSGSGLGRGVALGLALLMATLAAPADAASGSCAASGDTRADGGDSHSFADSCSGLATASGTVYVDGEEGRRFSFSQGALAGASASGGAGALHAVANVRASSDPMAYVYTNDQGETRQVDDVYLAQSAAHASATWRDTITVNMPVGTYLPNVVLDFHLQLSGRATASGAGAASVYAWLFVDHPRYPGLDIAMQLTGADLVGGVARTESAAGGFQWGVFDIQASLGADASAWAGRQSPGGGYVAWSEATADAANTAGFWIEVVTPGVTLSSASGHDYSSLPAVPEPASAALLAVGLLAVLGAAQRRRH